MKAVAKELGLPAWQLYDWRKLYAPRPGGGGPAPQTLEEAEKEIGRLRSELIRVSGGANVHRSWRFENDRGNKGLRGDQVTA